MKWWPRAKSRPEPQPGEVIRRLSLWRVLFALVIVGGLAAGLVSGVERRQNQVLYASADRPWFASYVDVTARPTFAFEQLGSTAYHDAILSFVVSMPSDACIPAWGGVFTLDAAGSELDLDRRIARLRQQGGNVAVSFGGLKNDELSLKCADEDKLHEAYKSVIERYDIDTIDLDLELEGLTDKEAALRRARVIARLQKDQRKAGKNLAVWLTLPVAPQGLTPEGTEAVSVMLKNGVDVAGVNVMTMNFGQSRGNASLLEGSKLALSETHRQLGILYKQIDIHLTSGTVWSKIGATPMIGQNDITDEIFTLDDAKGLNEFARAKGLARMSMWSANRDIMCGDNYVDVKLVSDSCSGVDQDKQSFAVALSEGFEGDITGRSGDVTASEDEAKAEPEKDDPATSPYQIWSESGAYLAGTKVVWRRNVYEAKWWTQGDVPDNPVLQSWETPWKLIGPVLDGEKPLPQAKLPAGTYPEWSGLEEYDAGDRVLFQGAPYQAKWWNKENSPAAASSNSDSSPWAPLTQDQVNKVIEQQKRKSR